LCKLIESHNICVVLLGDFNVCDYDWINGFSRLTYYYTKLRCDEIHNVTCYLGLCCITSFNPSHYD
jgi:hypothetical protein